MAVTQVSDCNGRVCQDTNIVCDNHAPHWTWSGRSSVAVFCSTVCALKEQWTFEINFVEWRARCFKTMAKSGSGGHAGG